MKSTLMPETQLAVQSARTYEEVLKKSRLSRDPQKTALIRKVGRRIAAAAEEFMRMNGMEDEIANYDWEFNLIDEDVPNAWCMPGGKVAFYTGILSYTRDETDIAVVMGHEVAHAVAKHGNERITHHLIQQGLGTAISMAAAAYCSEYQDAIMQVYGYGSQLGAILPYSRRQESEADRLGLIFMAMAGYNPGAAIDFWQRMAAGKQDDPPEFLSTHPSDETRIRNLYSTLPEAMKYYRPR